jgi:uncharacterized protein (TIGR02145 family)
MAENLAYLPFVRTSLLTSATIPLCYVYDYEDNSVTEAKATYNYNTYGVLYNWAAAKIACPSGWHLPADEEWAVLANLLGPYAGRKIKSNTMWSEKGDVDNSTGFSALPGGGSGWNGGFFWLGYDSHFWTATKIDSVYSWHRSLYWNHVDLNQYKADRRGGLSVRCLKDSVNTPPKVSVTMNPPVDIPSTIFRPDNTAVSDTENLKRDLEIRRDSNFDGRFTDDRDGHVYVYKKLGTQTWMAENLAYMPSVSPSGYGSETDPLYYVYGYEGDSVNMAILTAGYKTYGVLYNWIAAMNACPWGWHLPSETEWNTLDYFPGASPAGKLKESGTIHWKSPNAGTANQSGFMALPGGCRNPDGKFFNLGNFAYFWSSWQVGASSAWHRTLWNRNINMSRNILNRSYGFSVRCIRD